MTPEIAKQLCIEAHQGQFRRPSLLSETEKVTYSIYTYKLSFSESGKASLTTKNNSIISMNKEGFYYIQEPYSTHPIAVAELLNTDDEQILGYLHDVIENTEWYLHKANVGLTSLCEPNGTMYDLNIPLYSDLDLLTRKENQTYADYITGICKSKRATKVKIADIFTNIPTATKTAKIKYFTALKQLLKAL